MISGLSATHAAHRLKPIHPPKRLWHAGSIPPGRKFHILVAEDDANDRFFVRESFQSHPWAGHPQHGRGWRSRGALFAAPGALLGLRSFPISELDNARYQNAKTH